MPALDRLAKRQLVVVTGKGGVGKTTLAAALGRALARCGRRVLLLEVDPRESLHQALGTEPSGGEVVAVGPGLWLQNLRPAAVIEGLVREKVPVPYLARKIVESPGFRTFVEGAPGLKETALLGHAYRVLHGGRRARFDLVVLDAPATGHGLTLLAAPALLAQAADGGQLGAMAADLAAFLADPARCAVVVATLAEEMPVQETLELLAALEPGPGPQPELVVANGLFPPLPAGGAGTGPGAELWRQRRCHQEVELARLSGAWDGPFAELPLLPLDPGPGLVDALADLLARGRP